MPRFRERCHLHSGWSSWDGLIHRWKASSISTWCYSAMDWSEQRSWIFKVKWCEGNIVQRKIMRYSLPWCFLKIQPEAPVNLTESNTKQLLRMNEISDVRVLKWSEMVLIIAPLGMRDYACRETVSRIPPHSYLDRSDPWGETIEWTFFLCKLVSSFQLTVADSCHQVSIKFVSSSRLPAWYLVVLLLCYSPPPDHLN
jgi:hypothetical protein